MRSKCITCDTFTKLTICEKCVRKESNKQIAGIKTASDYHLVKGDWLINCLCFMDACGALEDFMETVSLETSIGMSGESHRFFRPEKCIDENIMEEYEYVFFPHMYEPGRKNKK